MHPDYDHINLWLSELYGFAGGIVKCQSVKLQEAEFRSGLVHLPPSSHLFDFKRQVETSGAASESKMTSSKLTRKTLPAQGIAPVQQSASSGSVIIAPRA